MYNFNKFLEIKHPFKCHPDQEMRLPRGSLVKNLPANAGDYLWVGKIAWRRKWPPTPVFLPGTFRGQRSLVGYNGITELDTSERLSTQIKK